MSHPLPSGLSFDDALTRRAFVHRLVGGTGLSLGRFGRIIGGAALTPLVFPNAAAAATLQATAEATLRSSPSHTTNFQGLAVSHLLAARQWHGVVRFDASQVQALAASANTVRLILTVADLQGLDPNFQLSAGVIGDQFGDSTCTWNSPFGNATPWMDPYSPDVDSTWNNRAGRAPFAISPIHNGLAPGQQVVYDVTAAVRSGASGWRISRDTTRANDGTVLYHDRHSGTAAYRPFLEFLYPTTPTVTATPTPTPTSSLRPTPTPTPTPSRTPAPTPSPPPRPTPAASLPPRQTPPPSGQPGADVPGMPIGFSLAGDWTRIGDARDATAIALRLEAGDGFADVFRNTLVWLAPVTGGPPDEYVIEAGSSEGATDLGILNTRSPATSATLSINDGTYFLRVRARNASGLGPPSNELHVVPGLVDPCTARPLAPGTLVAQSDQLRLSLGWGGAAGATAYVMEVGSAPGLANLARINVGRQTSFTAVAPAGTYYFRIRGSNACGLGDASNEVAVTLTATVPPPGVPGNIVALVNGRTVSLSWTAPAAGGVDDYVVEVGSQAGLSDLAIMTVAVPALTATDVPPGRYHVRVRARNAGGPGPATPDVIVDVT